MTNHPLATPQDNDPGTEGIVGYEYQREIAVLLCIRMLANKDRKYIVCEFHEDLLQIRRDLSVEFTQIKKKDGNWTLRSLLIPAKKQKLSILGKLFLPLQMGKNISRIHLWGYGKPGSDRFPGDVSLAELITLTKTPHNVRDTAWQAAKRKYIDFLSNQLAGQGINSQTIENALDILDIDFTMPHPEAIEAKCQKTLGDTLKDIWDVELSVPEIDVLYQKIYARVKQVSLQPGQPWTAKAISREEAISLITTELKKFGVAADRTAALTTQDKLTAVNLGEKVMYAFQRRLDAVVLRFELGLSPTQWEDYRSDINVKCLELRAVSPDLVGPRLWQTMRQAFAELGEIWSSKYDARLDRDFVEGVFFDMTGICEAQWMRVGHS
ncbi:MAG TPA: dsDNA nuclease domain-containing protein [Pedobacter sp.]|jgi:hypothetical protein